LVSVCLPVFNGEASLARALDSLLGQTYPHIELIISDNASTDGTEALCNAYSVHDNRVRYIRQEKNITQVPNMELVMNEAKGEYFLLGADDDYWHPTFIEKTKKILDTEPDYGVAMTSVQRIYDDGTQKDIVSYTGELGLTHLSYPEVFDLMTSERPIHLFFYGLIRTSLIHNMLRIPFPNSKGIDRVFMIEMSLATHFYALADILFEKTVHRQAVADRSKYKNEAVGKAYHHSKAHSQYVWAIVKRLLMSRTIPFTRKLWIYPLHMTTFVWRNRVFMREWLPRTFKFLLKSKARVRKMFRNTQYV